MRKLLPIILISMLLAACGKLPEQHIEGTAFGTIYHITYLGDRSDKLPRQVDSVLKEINRTFSIFDTNSIISRINQGEDLLPNKDFLKVMEASSVISEQTHGAFDCTCQPLIELWGFGRGNKKTVVPQAQIDSVKQFVGSQLVSVQNGRVVKADPRVQLNFNAIAKGYAVDQVARFLNEQGYADCIVEIGGEVVARGTKNGKPWRVGIQVPTETADGPAESSESFDLQDRAVATSGNYRNYFEQDGVRYTHILDPVTGKPEQTNLLSVTVIAPDCLTADAYATAFMVLGMEKSQKVLDTHPELEAWFICDDHGKYIVKTYGRTSQK
ncbi:MAG: FAD:protein FMN transferase [Bacteroidales bacterium]|nr:FAD:protein FMN transferase [Bacteroidales bacterium]